MREKMRKQFNSYGTMPENCGYEKLSSDSDDTDVDIEHENCKRYSD